MCYLPPPLASRNVEGHLAVGSQSGVIAIYNLAFPLNEPEILYGHSSNVCALHASTDGRRIVSGSWDGNARVWNLVIPE